MLMDEFQFMFLHLIKIIISFVLYNIQHLDITFSRDPTSNRPSINKLDSTRDKAQKAAGTYYVLDD